MIYGNATENDPKRPWHCLSCLKLRGECKCTKKTLLLRAGSGIAIRLPEGDAYGGAER